MLQKQSEVHGLHRLNYVMYDTLSLQDNAGKHHPGLATQEGMGLIFINYQGQPLVNAIIANNPGMGVTGRIVSGLDSNKCLDNSAGLGVWRNKVQIWDCDNYAPAQKWSLNSKNDTLNIGGGCLDILDNRTDDGAPVAWFSCRGGANQQWVKTASGELRNPASDKCLDVPSSNTKNGTQLQLFTCNGRTRRSGSCPANPGRGSGGSCPCSPSLPRSACA